MQDIIKDQMIRTSISLEEYIPLKVLIDGKYEPVRYLSYSKDKTSLLEITLGITSGSIKRVTLLSSLEYDINDSKLRIDDYEEGDLKLNDESKYDCAVFRTHLYENGIRIVISGEKVFRFIKIDRLYVGLSDLDRIAEICLCQLTSDEVDHIKYELDHQ